MTDPVTAGRVWRPLKRSEIRDSSLKRMCCQVWSLQRRRARSQASLALRQTGRTNDRPRNSRPRVTSQRQDRYLLLILLRNRMLTADDIAFLSMCHSNLNNTHRSFTVILTESWHRRSCENSRLRIYIPWGEAEENIDRKPGMLILKLSTRFSFMRRLIHEIWPDRYFEVNVERMSDVRKGTSRNTKNENKRHKYI
jgi:hypothetical protein